MNDAARQAFLQARCGSVGASDCAKYHPQDKDRLRGFQGQSDGP